MSRLPSNTRFFALKPAKKALAHRLFDDLRKKGNRTAQTAFENIDRPLREGIARWRRVLEVSPDNFSAHEELAHLAEHSGELNLAAEHFEKAWRLRPERRALLVDLGRVWLASNRPDDADPALLAASRGVEPRTAEDAESLLPKRYPFVNEFKMALDLDPFRTPGFGGTLRIWTSNCRIAPEAEKELEQVVQQTPDDVQSVAQLGLLRLDRGRCRRSHAVARTGHRRGR